MERSTAMTVAKPQPRRDGVDSTSKIAGLGLGLDLDGPGPDPAHCHFYL